MDTHIPIDADLPGSAFEPSGAKTGRAAVDTALREFIARRERMTLRALFGGVEWSTDFDDERGRTRT